MNLPLIYETTDVDSDSIIHIWEDVWMCEEQAMPIFSHMLVQHVIIDIDKVELKNVHVLPVFYDAFREGAIKTYHVKALFDPLVVKFGDTLYYTSLEIMNSNPKSGAFLVTFCIEGFGSGEGDHHACDLKVTETFWFDDKDLTIVWGNSDGEGIINGPFRISYDYIERMLLVQKT